MNQKKIRTYELSVWTLQDDFITVLKPVVTENKGTIVSPKAKLNVDGTQTLEFKIPCYILQDGVLQENPLWKTTQDNTLIENLNKIKLILNKKDEDEKVFEFIILKIEEGHDKDIGTYCQVECEGLAFHELGRVGYKISLSTDDFYDEYQTWAENPENTPEPLANIDYWLKKFLTPFSTVRGFINPAIWYYTIQMDWGSYSGNNLLSNKIYEEAYVGNWTTNGTTLTPGTTVYSQEKARLVDFEESNKYNLTQNLAEAFGVFCRYEYEHDEHYHITGRKIVFYNNFLNENDGYVDLTYPYSATNIVREIDSSDLVTKLFVKPVDASDTADNLITIMNVEANPSKEDYILNFDYLHDIGTISEEQYNKISSYEAKMKKLNEQFVVVAQLVNSLDTQLITLKATQTTAKNAVQLDKEQLSSAEDLLNEITDNTGIISITEKNPETAILLQDKSAGAQSNSYYIKISKKGIIKGTLKIYRTCQIEKQNGENVKVLSNELTTGIPVADEYGDVIKVNNLYKSNENDSNLVYLTYDYSPQLYYEKVKQIWTSRLEKDEHAYWYSSWRVDVITEKLEEANAEKTRIMNEQEEERHSFERLMGPALREGYWTPDDYKDYGDHYNNWWRNLNTNPTINAENEMCEFIWDKEPFDDEILSTYKIKANEEIENYPCVILPSTLFTNNVSTNISRLDQLSFMFYDYTETEKSPWQDRRRRCYSLGSECQLGFTKITSGNAATMVPILILTGASSLTADELRNKIYATNSPVIGSLSAGNDTVSLSDWSVTSGLQFLEGKVDIYYPRIMIKSMALKLGKNQLTLGYNQSYLEEYKDYYILSRNQKISTYDYKPYQFITFKPEALVRYGTNVNKSLSISFIISNADLSIYLDAKKIAKENAYPKVSYEIDTNIVDTDFMRKAYAMLAHLVHINDTQLKLKSARGYISEVELDLDQPWNDKYEVKNYKNKFEDLFSTILASTEEMKKSGGIIEAAGALFTTNGELNPTSFEGMLRKVDLNYAFNNGKLTISEENGIWGVSESGVVAYRGGGIFTANTKDAAGNWIWNTGILPSGINADLITSGQLDTNRVMVYAGDRLRFQLNGEGLFAYKSFFEDLNEGIITGLLGPTVDKINEKLAEGNEFDAAQFVKMDPNGLFLIAKEGAMVLNRDKTEYLTIETGTEYIIGTNVPKVTEETEVTAGEETETTEGIEATEEINVTAAEESNEEEQEEIQYEYQTETKQMYIPEEGLKRVEISWDGLIMRDWSNEKTFFADPDTGDLYLTGTIFAQNFYLIDDTIANGYFDENGNNKRILFTDWLKLQLEADQLINDTLKEIWDKAGEILSAATTTLNGVNAITLENFDILNGFLNEAKNLKPSVFTSALKPSSFKPGDIWEPTSGEYAGNKYIAISFSDKSNDANINNPLAGWNRTYDGSLGSIAGAGIDIDAVAGTIDIKAKSQLDLASGDIQITGNHSINIGSKWINIGSANGGINIVSTNIDENTTTGNDGKVNTTGVISKVQIDRNGLIMHSNKIELMAGDNDSVAAMRLSPSKGIWLGSNQEIRLFSGVTVSSDIREANETEEAYNTSVRNGSSVLISPTKILYGVSNLSSQTTAVEMTEDYIVLAAGDKIDDLRQYDVNTSNMAGVKITSTSIGMAIGSGNDRNLIYMDGDGIDIGSANDLADANNAITPNYTGNFIKLSKSKGVIIGSSSKFTLNATNVALYTTETTESNVSSSISNYSKSFFRLGPKTNPGLLYYSDGTNNQLHISGDIYAKSFKLVDSNTITLSNGNSVDLSNVGGIISTEIRYYATNSTSSSPPSGVTWKTSISATNYSSSYPYLWTRKRFIYTNGSSSDYMYEYTYYGSEITITVSYYVWGATGHTNEIDAPAQQDLTSISNWESNYPSSSFVAGTFLITKTSYGNTSSYSVAKYGQDGTVDTSNLNYLTNSIQVYKLYADTITNASSITNLPAYNNGWIYNSWTVEVPTYTSGKNYWSCYIQDFNNGTHNVTTPVKENGLTVLYSNMNSATSQAQALVAAHPIFTENGLSNYSLQLNNDSTVYYPVALTSTGKLIIGANQGIDLVSTNDNFENGVPSNYTSAISLNSDGITLNGKSITLTSTGSSFVLDSTAIRMGTAGTVIITSNNSESYFSFDNQGNQTIKISGDGTIKCKKLIVEDADGIISIGNTNSNVIWNKIYSTSTTLTSTWHNYGASSTNLNSSLSTGTRYKIVIVTTLGSSASTWANRTIQCEIIFNNGISETLYYDVGGSGGARITSASYFTATSGESSASSAYARFKVSQGNNIVISSIEASILFESGSSSGGGNTPLDASKLAVGWSSSLNSTTAQIIASYDNNSISKSFDFLQHANSNSLHYLKIGDTNIGEHFSSTITRYNNYFYASPTFNGYLINSYTSGDTLKLYYKNSTSNSWTEISSNTTLNIAAGDTYNVGYAIGSGNKSTFYSISAYSSTSTTYPKIIYNETNKQFEITTSSTQSNDTTLKFWYSYNGGQAYTPINKGGRMELYDTVELYYEINGVKTKYCDIIY